MNKLINNKIVVILGPTSSGKSDVAIKLAKKFNGEIISADSRQIYRGLDIGSGKVEADRLVETPQEFTDSKFYARISKIKPFISEGVPHYMIDVISPRTNFSAAQFKKKTDKIIENISKRGKLSIICGGTGFWIKSVVDDVIYPKVKPDFVLRNRLRNRSAEKLFVILKKLDPARAKDIDAKNKVRLIRSIEICKSLGIVPTAKHQALNTKHKFLQIGISPGKEKLHNNIKKRLKKRFEAGMIEEVKKLHFKDKLSWKRLESFGLGYKLIPQYLKGEIETKKDLFEKVYGAEKDYAKRQMTWFKKDKRIIWLSACRKGRGKYKDIEREVEVFIG